MLSNAKAAVIGKHPLFDFLSPTTDGNKFVEIESEILAVMQSQVQANNYGLRIDFLGIKSLGFPENVTASVFERMQAERKRLADKSQFEGEAEAQTIRADADRKAAVVLADAGAQATAIRGKGEAEAAKSLTVFQQNPELANFIFGLSALEDSLKDQSTLIFDQNTPPFDLFNGVSTNLFKHSSPMSDRSTSNYKSRPSRRSNPERPVDTGSEALTEALRSSFWIVKVVMVLLRDCVPGSGFFTVGPRNKP